MTTFSLQRVDATNPAVWARIVVMDAECFGDDGSPALSDNEGAWWIAYSGKTEAGYCGVSKTPLGNAYLCRAGVLPKFRGRGLQKQMIQKRVRWARAHGLPAVVTDTHENVASANSLIACGFRLYEPESKWSFETALYWRKQLTPAQ